MSTLDTVRVLGTAEEELRQAPGVSTITAEDLRDRPPANDISDLVRRMPGVNLTGNSSSGAYGNNRQIDLRGMGPENTLILIDVQRVRDYRQQGRKQQDAHVGGVRREQHRGDRQADSHAGPA